MVDPLTAIQVGSAVVGVAKKAFGKRSRPNNRAAIASLRSAKPTGYLTGEDRRAAELTRGRLTEGVQAQSRLNATEVSRRARARGLAGSPSEERSQGRVNAQTALGAQHAGETAEEQLYNVQRGREAFQQESELAIFGAETNQAARESQRMQAEDAMFWNSLNEFMPTILGGINPASRVTAGPTRGGGFNPAGPRIRKPGPVPF